MHRFPIWHLSWWIYHAILGVGFLATAILLISLILLAVGTLYRRKRVQT